MRSPHSGFLAGVLGWGCFFRADTVIPLGPFGVNTGLTGLALRVAALPVLGVFVCVGIGFHRSGVWKICFWCSPIVCQAFAGEDWFQCVLVLSGVGGVAVPRLTWALWG